MAWSPAKKKYALRGQSPATPLAATRTPSSSTMFLQGKYKISRDKVLGEGGFGTVYQGLDVLDCRGVAVKVYKGSESAMASFKKSVDVLLTLRRRAARAPPEGGFDSTMELSLLDASTMSFKPSLLGEDIGSLGAAFKDSAQLLIGQMDFSGCFVSILGYSRDHLGAPGLDVESEMLYIVFELGLESLQDRLLRCAEDGNMLCAQELRCLQWDLVSIVCGLHSQGYVHLDIKPQNIVRFRRENGESQWKLIDLDGAMKTGTMVKLQDLSVTKHYMSPELASAFLRLPVAEGSSPSRSASRGLQLSRLMDVWSVGMCALEAIFLTPILGPWYTQWKEQTGTDVKFMAWLSDLQSEPIVSGDMQAALADIDADMCDMLRGMLAKDTLDRYSITECLTHRWFAPIRATILEDVKALVRPMLGADGEDHAPSSIPLPPTENAPQLQMRSKSPPRSKAGWAEANQQMTASQRIAAKRVSARACAVM